MLPSQQIVRASAGNAPSSLRILLVSSDNIVPSPSGSGNSAIRWGLLSGLSSCGATLGYFAANLPSPQADNFRFSNETEVSFRSSETLDARALAAFIADFQADVVLAYGPEPLRLVRDAGFRGPTGVMSIDLEFIPVVQRLLYNLRFGQPKQKLKSLLLSPKIAVKFAGLYREVVRTYPLADFVINHAEHHAKWHAAKHGRPVLYTPNPLAPVYDNAPTRSPASPPRFALVGGIGGIATLTGLTWFAQNVYPLLEPVLAAGELEIHLIGRGSLDPVVDRITPRLIRRGFVADLTDEFTTMTAMLVPTPITLGFRTRIVDSFRHGVTVVAHEANRVGFPELSHGVNALIAASPEAFAAGVRHLAANPATAERLGRTAFEQFGSTFSAAHSAAKILSFVSARAIR